jgi:hypothetical protein
MNCVTQSAGRCVEREKKETLQLLVTDIEV